MSKIRTPKVNQIIIAGNITKDPELREVGANHTPLVKLSIAYNNSYKKGDDWVEDPNFFIVECWRGSASKALKLKKGDPVLIEGSLKQQRWKTDMGENRSMVVINASKINGLVNFKEREEYNEYDYN